MGFAMRMKLADEIIRTESFRNLYINGKKNGFEFEVQLAYYRGHYLSDIDEISVSLDGKTFPDEAVTFELNGKEMPLYKIKWAVTEFWSQTEYAKIRVLTEGGVSNGKHELSLTLMLRVPYMKIGAGHSYMPLDSGDTVTVEVNEAEALTVLSAELQHKREGSIRCRYGHVRKEGLRGKSPQRNGLCRICGQRDQRRTHPRNSGKSRKEP